MRATSLLRIGIALSYLAALLVLPLALVATRAFEQGASAFWEAVTTPEALHALKLTLIVAAIAVPANAIFGVAAALALAPRRGRAAAVIATLIDLPLALSPIVAGLAVLLAWGAIGWFGPWLIDVGIPIIYAVPGMVLATALISLPFVMREILPVLRELGTDQQQAASTLGASRRQIFLRITLPSIRPALVYGVVLTAARALGEYGAVAVVSGRIRQGTQTLPLHVKDRFDGFDQLGAYAAALVLGALAVAILLLLHLISPGRRTT